MNGIFGHNVLQGTGGIGLGLIPTDNINAANFPDATQRSEVLAVTQAYNAAWKKLMDGGMTDAQANRALKESKTDPTYAIWSLTVHPSFPLTSAQQAAVAYATEHGGGTTTSGAITKDAGSASSTTLPTPKSNTGLIVGGVVALAAIGGFVAWKKGLFGKKAA